MKPYYDQAGVTIYHGDCREVMPELDAFDVILADPPYGSTSLAWDKRVDGWLDLLRGNNLWCFGALSFFMRQEFAGWHYAQELVWEKQNGSGFHADRFRRVHELIVQFYRGRWSDVYKCPVKTHDAVARTVRSKKRPAHMGDIERSAYVSFDGGPRLMRSVLRVASAHGYAKHPTQKPVKLITPLLEYSCPPGGRVLDPFMGSGSFLLAAMDSGRRAVGIEIDERYCEIAAKRLAL
jgi:site-specific DNA-methyltransferase (adenine-specific)